MYICICVCIYIYIYIYTYDVDHAEGGLELLVSGLAGRAGWPATG